MIHIDVDSKDPQGLTKALSKFKTAVKKAGLMDELRTREHHTPSNKAKRDRLMKAGGQRARDAKQAQRKR